MKSVLWRLAYHGGMAEGERDIILFVLSLTSTDLPGMPLCYQVKVAACTVIMWVMCMI